MSTRDTQRTEVQRSPTPLRAIHGVNLGPVERMWTLDQTPRFTDAGIPSVRVHDASIFIGEVVDLHTIFPNPLADPNDPASYRFALTDWYFDTIEASGAEIYLRLGESIEHEPVKRYLDLARWPGDSLAVVCANIVRHCNLGWADGHHRGLRHAEFWNEPDNRWYWPREERPCYSGTVAAFVTAYDQVARAVHEADPTVQIGLAGFGYPAFVDPADTVDRSPWATVLDDVVAAGSPLDFVSWHRYTERWDQLTELTTAVRTALDLRGLTGVASHVTEWRYHPRLLDTAGKVHDWASSVASGDGDLASRGVAALNDDRAGAFTFGALLDFSDSDVAITHHYTGISSYWGIFEDSGRPTLCYRALQLYGHLVAAAPSVERLPVELSEGRMARAVAHRAGETTTVTLAWLPDRELSETPSSLKIRLPEGAHKILSTRTATAEDWRSGPLTSVADGEMLLTGLEPGIHEIVVS